MPLLFVYLMSRATATGPFDMRVLFKSPSRTLGWLMLGNSILMAYRVNYAAQMRENNAAKSQMMNRVSENE